MTKSVPKSVKVGPFVVLCFALLAGLVLSGCREEDQGRIIIFEKGRYLGLPDQKLDADQVKSLQHRTQQQGYN